MSAQNLLLASLSASDAAAIQPHLKPIRLEHRKILFEMGNPVDAVYFPTTAIISLVVGLSSGEMVEAAMVGRDGVVGARWEDFPQPRHRANRRRQSRL
jgi:hypothetical protein